MRLSKDRVVEFCGSRIIEGFGLANWLGLAGLGTAGHLVFSEGAVQDTKRNDAGDIRYTWRHLERG
jgi:hypothetical protein